MKIWLDDERPMAEGYDRHVRSATEAISLLESKKITAISLDHDLGETGGTGYEVDCFIESGAFWGTLPPIEVNIHSANPVGRDRMEQAISRAMEYWDKSASSVQF
ncbi:MAG: cyclic-phosphate processing receiver domain-containing protein [Deltaproteobacteria bacterium]